MHGLLRYILRFSSNEFVVVNEMANKKIVYNIVEGDRVPVGKSLFLNIDSILFMFFYCITIYVLFVVFLLYFGFYLTFVDTVKFTILVF